MDPVIAVLLQAAGVIGSTLLSETAKRAVGETWDTAMKAIKRRLGADHPAPALAERLRSAGDAEAEAAPLREQLAKMQLGDDPELLDAVRPLSAALSQHGLQAPTVYANTIKGAAVVMGNQTNHFD